MYNIYIVFSQTKVGTCMFTNNKRILRIMIISVLLNFVLFTFAYFLNLPLWLDTTGTIYAACLLGAPAGFIVAIINNITEAIFFYGDQSLFFYFVSLLTAFIAGQIAKKYADFKLKKWIYMLIALLLAESIFSVLITFVANKGIPSNYWSNHIYYKLTDSGVGNTLATVWSVLIIKIPDVIVSVLLVIVSLICTPKKLKNTDNIILDKIEDAQRI